MTEFYEDWTKNKDCTHVYVVSKFVSQSKSSNFKSPKTSFKFNDPKNVALYVSGLPFFKFTPSNLNLPFWKGALFNSILDNTFLRASNENDSLWVKLWKCLKNLLLVLLAGKLNVLLKSVNIYYIHK